MSVGQSPSNSSSPYHRCAGPNCGILKGSSDRWWLMWTSFADYKHPVLYLAPWDEDLSQKEGSLPVCGELCAQRLQSQFMDNVLQNQLKRTGR